MDVALVIDVDMDMDVGEDRCGLYDAHVNGCVLMRILSRLMTWQHGHWRMNWVIVRSVIVGSLRRSLHFSKPQWPTMELCTVAICLKIVSGMR